ncbi:unnamed protein product [Arabis nemorensis]|uniref:Uncharacterized protein n=1 Tax=Arabis nemorensis TaxID=586526 RepID=A0A565CMB6_9BRAS|nr:unnamed protein product [Arabis nemorensis]
MENTSEASDPPLPPAAKTTTDLPPPPTQSCTDFLQETLLNPLLESQKVFDAEFNTFPPWNQLTKVHYDSLLEPIRKMEKEEARKMALLPDFIGRAEGSSGGIGNATRKKGG